MYQRILVPTDGSEVSNQAVQEAAKLAKDQHAQLCLVHVVDLTGLYRTIGSGVHMPDIEQTLLHGGQQELNQAQAIAANDGIAPETVLIRSDSGRISTAIVDQAKRWPAEMIVMGSHGRGGLERMFLGSVAEWVVRVSPAPVLLIR